MVEAVVRAVDLAAAAAAAVVVMPATMVVLAVVVSAMVRTVLAAAVDVMRVLVAAEAQHSAFIINGLTMKRRKHFSERALRLVRRAALAVVAEMVAAAEMHMAVRAVAEVVDSSTWRRAP